MLFTSLLSLLALTALVQSAPAPAELEARASKYRCVTKRSGKLSGVRNDNPFWFTKSGSLVTYSGDHPTKNVLYVEFQACTNATTGKFLDAPYDDDYIGRLRVKKTNSCIQLTTKNGVGSPKIAPCNSKKLTDAQTWKYDKDQFGLYWAGWFDFGQGPDDNGGYVCRGGYIQYEDGKPKTTSKKQIKMDCAREEEDYVGFWDII